MKPLAEQMAIYSAYHRNGVNKAIHFVFVPAIVWCIMVALDLVALGKTGSIPVTLAMPVTAALLVWYLMLDFSLGVAATVFFTLLYTSAATLHEAVDTRTALLVAGALFVASWIFQFLGHGIWEHRRPALADNITQVFVAPIFLVAELAFALGLRKELEGDVRTRMVPHLPTGE